MQNPAYTKRISEYNPETRQYAAYVAIDGEPEQLIGYAWSAGAADRLCDEYAYNFYADNHTPEVAAQIAVGMFGPMVICPHCGDEHDAWSHCPGVCSICGKDHATSYGTCIADPSTPEVAARIAVGMLEPTPSEDEPSESAPHTPQALDIARVALEAAEVATTEARAAALPSKTRPRVLWSV